MVFDSKEYTQMFVNPVSCAKCGYRADCDGYWTYCPYDAQKVSEKKGVK